MANVMPSGAVDTFTGANGTTVAGTNWTIPKADNGGTAQIQSNACRIRTGASSGNRTSIKLNISNRADTEVDFIWTVPSTAQYAYLFMRGDSLIDTNSGYYLSLKATDMEAGDQAGYSGSDIQTYTHGFTGGQVVHTRVAMFGNRLRARTWLQSNSEPTSIWQIDVTNSSHTTGAIGITTVSGSAGAKDLIVDSFNATDTLTPSQATLAAGGSITAGGSLLKQPRKAFTGSITAAGTLAKMRVVVRNFTGSITAAGALRKALPRNFTGSITATGTLRRRPAKIFTGSITPAATILKHASRRFAGSVTATGALVSVNVGRVFGSPGQVVMTLLQRSQVRIRHRKG